MGGQRNSYPYRRSRHRNRYYSGYSNVSRVGSQTRDAAREYVRKCLFTLDNPRKRILFANYEALYGKAAGQYLRETLTKWGTGRVKMSDQSEQRILECVPRVMTVTEQYELLVISSNRWLRKLDGSDARRLPRPIGSVNELRNVYINAITRVISERPELDWFVKNVFTNEELNEYLSCLRFLAIQRYLQTFRAIQIDLASVLPIDEIEGCRVRSSYVDKLTNHLIEGVGRKDLECAPIEQENPIPALVSRIGHENAWLISERIMNEQYAAVVGKQTVNIGRDDMNSALTSLAELPPGADYDASYVIHGSGGDLYVHIQRRNVFKLRAEIAAYVLLQGVLIAFSLIVAWKMLFSSLWHASIAILIGVITGMIKLQEKVQAKKRELELYER